MKRAITATALLASALTLLAVWAAGWASLPSQVKFQNEKVLVTEVTSAPGASRERGIRHHDQVIVFMDDCTYQRTDPKTGEKTVRSRKSGDAIWHSKGEDAPLLINVGQKPYRTMVIELK